MGKMDEQIAALLQKLGKPMTLTEISEALDQPTKKVFKGLQKLFSDGKIECDVKTRTYSLTKS